MKFTVLFLTSVLISVHAFAQNYKAGIPASFVKNYYSAYSNTPTAEKLLPFYADSVVIDDPTFDWIGKTKGEIFKNFTRNNANNHYTWQIHQQISRNDTLVTEGLLLARYAGIPYQMRFVNIFHFQNGKIIRQYDYFDNKDWYGIVEQSNKTKTREADEQALRKLKTIDWPKAYREQDTALLNRILADEFKMIDSDGILSTKEDQLAYIKIHKPSYASFEFKIDRLDIFENNMAVVSGKGIIRGSDTKGKYVLEYISSNVFLKQNGLWKAVASHTSGDKKSYL
jgi:ketosteroid isomerase-like protein